MAASLAAVVLLFFFVLLPNQMFSVPFSTFKQNFDAAPRVAVVLLYSNQSQFVAELRCATLILQSLGSRNTTTIDFYSMNQTLCTYQKGLGYIAPLTDTPVNCLIMAGPEPAITLNHSATNYRTIMAYKLSVYGNSDYSFPLNSTCPIAVSLS